MKLMFTYAEDALHDDNDRIEYMVQYKTRTIKLKFRDSRDFLVDFRRNKIGPISRSNR